MEKHNKTEYLKIMKVNEILGYEMYSKQDKKKERNRGMKNVNTAEIVKHLKSFSLAEDKRPPRETLKRK
jgi:hypothetical protein